MQDDNRVDEYLKRIEMNRPTNGPDKEYLIQLHIGHLTHIPFETFDLIDLKQLNISLDYVFDRIVRQHRGGVCYQMNGLFAFILKSFHYNVQLIPCGVYSVDKAYYYDNYSHLSLCVTLDNGEMVLCDVGFSRDYLTPLVFRTDCIQYATNGYFRLTNEGVHYKLEKGLFKEGESITLPNTSTPQTQIIDVDPERINWIISYRFPMDFSKRTMKLVDFEGTCSYILNDPDVILNHCTICRMHTYKPFIGSRGIVGKKYFEWKFENGTETRTSIPLSDSGDQELKEFLKEKFHLMIERKLELVG